MKQPIDLKESNYEFEYDEFMEYVLLRPKRTGLPMECYAADCVESWKYRNHDMWFLMKNDYGETHDVVPFTVEDNPKMVGTYDLKISQNDINKVVEFIRRNKDGLIALGNGKIYNTDFINMIKNTK